MTKYFDVYVVVAYVLQMNDSSFRFHNITLEKCCYECVIPSLLSTLDFVDEFNMAACLVWQTGIYWSDVPYFAAKSYQYQYLHEYIYVVQIISGQTTAFHLRLLK